MPEPRRWSAMSELEKVQLILKHIIPHDMGDDIRVQMGDIVTPRGAGARRFTYPVAAWDEGLECWVTRDIGSNGATMFDPLHNLNDTWQVVERITQPPTTLEEPWHSAPTRFAMWWNWANLWVYTGQEAAEAICKQALILVGVVDPEKTK